MTMPHLALASAWEREARALRTEAALYPAGDARRVFALREAKRIDGWRLNLIALGSPKAALLDSKYHSFIEEARSRREQIGLKPGVPEMF